MVRYVWQSDNWPAWSWDSSSLLKGLSGVRGGQGRLLAMVDSLLPEDAIGAAGDAAVEETITNSAVEGERLDERHVRSSVVRRLGIEWAGLPEPHSRELALVDALLDATRGHADMLTEKRLFSWHAALFPSGYSGLRTVRVGGWRQDDPMQVVSGPVGRERVHFEAPPSQRIPVEMATFIDWWNSPPKGLDGLLRAAVAHLWFVTIHPFDDGNGRLARLLTEMALAQDEQRALRAYSLSGQILARRDDYYSALAQAQRSDGGITQWLQWFLVTLESAIQAGQRNIEGVLARSRFWQRHRLAPINVRQRKALDKMLDAGINGFQGGMTTRRYASLNRVSKPTAFRELAELRDLGLLKSTGAGRSVRYGVAWEG